MRPNNPNRIKMVEVLRRCEADNYAIKTTAELATAIGVSYVTAVRLAEQLEMRGELTRDQHGAFVLLTPSNDFEAKSGVHRIPKLTPEQIAEGRALSRTRAKPKPKPFHWMRGAIIDHSDVALEGAPASDPELGRQIRESRGVCPPKLPHAELMKVAAARFARARASKLTPAQLQTLEDNQELEQARKASEATMRREEANPKNRSKHCFKCMDMSHRRPRNGLCKCGKAFEPEAIEISHLGRSSIAMFG